MTRREIPADAPAFDPDRNDYPLSGSKVGPIWRAAWWLMRDLGQYSGAHVVAHVQRDHPEANPETIRNLLYAAVRAGVLEQENRPVAGSRGVRRVAHFRIKS